MSEGNIKNNTNCCVYGCNSRKSKDPEIHFHYFPVKNKNKVYVTNIMGIIEEIDQRKAWENFLLMEKQVTKHMRVCSRHFKPEDYIMKTGTITSKVSPRLRKKAVPSQNLPMKSILVNTSNLAKCVRHDRLLRINQLREQLVSRAILAVPESSHPDEAHSADTSQFLNLTIQEQEAVDGLLQLF